MKPWWIASVAPSLERRAKTVLEDIGFEVWLPERLVSYKSNRMTRAVQRYYPQFPGYAIIRSTGARPVYEWKVETIDGERRNVRVKLGEVEHEHAAAETAALDCVHGVRMNAGRPSLCSDMEVQNVRAHLDAIRDIAIDMSVWRVNDLARITAGPFIGFNSIVRALGSKPDRFMMAIAIFGRESLVEMSSEQLERVA